MDADLRTFLISTVVVLLGFLGNHWSNKFTLKEPTIFYTIEQQENNNKVFISVDIINSSEIVIDTFYFNTNIDNLIDIEFSKLKSANLSIDSLKWCGRFYADEKFHIFIYSQKKSNFDYLENIKNSISGKYRDSKTYQWQFVALQSGTPGLKLFFSSLFWYALPFLLAILLYAPFLIVKLVNKKKLNKSAKKIKEVPKEILKDLTIWETQTNRRNPQWTDYIEIDLKENLLESITCNLSSELDYIRFGFKILDKQASIFGQKGIPSADNSYLFHVSKGINSSKMGATVIKGHYEEHQDFNLVDYDNNIPIVLKLVISKTNELSFYVNNNEIYKTKINYEVRERLAIMAWGDGHEFKMKVTDIILKTK